MRWSEKGFTLTEIVVTLVITGVAVIFFNTVFLNNWFAYEDRIKRANLWNEANLFFDDMSVVGRNSKQVDVDVTAGAKTATFYNALDNSTTVYSIDNTGKLSRTENATTQIFSDHAVLADCNLVPSGKNLLVDLKLKENNFTRDIFVTASTEILSRN